MSIYTTVPKERSYKVAEAYYTIQGEGMHVGRPAVFVRFRGCNLWNGKEDGRARPACVAWCDVVPLEEQEPGVAGRTSFARMDGPMGGSYGAQKLAEMILGLWPAGTGRRPYAVLTGGEPTVQIDRDLVRALDTNEIDVGVETNGTLNGWLPLFWHVCVSPKGAYGVNRTSGNELKLVVPQDEVEAAPAEWEKKARAGDIAFDRYYLQPKEVPDEAVWSENILSTVAYVQTHPFWRLSLQTHKMLGLP